ncbi:dihydrofolate reductase [Burkholderiales bacterium]|nr:dihydrofolate reductase [Burkholderiales bacterium]
MGITIIVAQAKNRTIGVKGTLPWHLSADLKRFKQLTTGNTVIMGRKTWDSIGKSLPNRKNIVITRNSDLILEDAQTVTSLEAALHAAPNDSEKFIIGGAEIYNLAMSIVDTIEMTLIHEDVSGDTYFPLVNSNVWKESKRSEHQDCKSDLNYSFITYKRVNTL